MKKNETLSILEFETFCMGAGISTYVFDTDTDENDKSIKMVSMSLAFDNMVISKNPNTIVLTSGDKNFFGRYASHICFHRVKYIVFNGETVGYKVFTIVCGNINDEDTDEKYIVKIS